MSIISKLAAPTTAIVLALSVTATAQAAPGSGVSAPVRAARAPVRVARVAAPVDHTGHRFAMLFVGVGH